jgi:hypothetical protein
MAGEMVPTGYKVADGKDGIEVTLLYGDSLFVHYDAANSARFVDRMEEMTRDYERLAFERDLRERNDV